MLFEITGGVMSGKNVYIGEEKKSELYGFLETMHTQFVRATPLFYGEIVRAALNDVLHFPFPYANASYRNYDDSFFHFLLPGTDPAVPVDEYGGARDPEMFIDYLLFDHGNDLFNMRRGRGFADPDSLGRIGEMCRTMIGALDRFLEIISRDPQRYQEKLAVLGLTPEHFDVQRNGIEFAQNLRGSAQGALDIIDPLLSTFHGREPRTVE